MLRSFCVKTAVLLCALLAGGCVTKTTGNITKLKEPSRAERAQELSQTKTQIAVEFMKTKDYRNAVDSIKQAIAANGNNEMAWMVQGIIYQSMNVHDTADESFRRALAIKPDSAEINNNYGWFICDTLRQPLAATVYFDRALADPTYPTPEIAYMNKGICEARGRQFAAAEMSLAKARSVAPWFMPSIKEQARMKLLQGDSSQARRLFETYQSRIEILLPDDLLLGWQIARAQGDTQAAYEYEAQLRGRFPYSEELQQIGRGH